MRVEGQVMVTETEGSYISDGELVELMIGELW